MRQLFEKDIQSQCLQYLTLTGIFCWRQNQGAFTGDYKGKRRFVRFSTMPGISDILGILKPTGRFLAIEVKRPGNKPSPEQLAFLDVVRANGGLALVVYSLDDLIEGLRKEGI